MDRLIKELENYSYPLNKSDLVLDSEEKMVEVIQKNHLNSERIKKNLEVLEIQKVSIENSWNSFVFNLRDCNGIYRVTDRTNGAHPYSFKLEILISNKFGIGFCMSLIGRLIGIYFTGQNSKSLVPIRNFPSAIDGISQETRNPFISYFPFSEDQLEVTFQLIELSELYFPDFKLFNNLTATTKVKNMVIGNRMILESDLFQVLFTNNMVVI
jgi:hypothetical protein